ncbi:MAG: hypothetical protein ABUK11_01695 [Mariprofundaceae bacterium]
MMESDNNSIPWQTRKAPEQGRVVALAFTGIALSVAALSLVVLSITVPGGQQLFIIPNLVRAVLALTGIIALYAVASLTDWVMDSLTFNEHEQIEEVDIHAALADEALSPELWISEKARRLSQRGKCDQLFLRWHIFGYGYLFFASATGLFLVAIISLGIEQFYFTSETVDYWVSLGFPLSFLGLLMAKMLTFRLPDSLFISGFFGMLILLLLTLLSFGSWVT